MSNTTEERSSSGASTTIGLRAESERARRSYEAALIDHHLLRDSGATTKAITCSAASLREAGTTYRGALQKLEFKRRTPAARVTVPCPSETTPPHDVHSGSCEQAELAEKAMETR
jgi:hypothetical protein